MLLRHAGAGGSIPGAQFTPVLTLYDPFGVDVPLNLDNTHSLDPGCVTEKDINI